MVSPARRREAVAHVQARFDASQRRVCRAMDQPRSTQRYRPAIRSDEPALIRRLHELVRHHPRYGYRRIWALLRADGEGSLAEFGSFFSSLQIKSFAFYDAKQRKPEELEKLTTSFFFPCQTKYMGAERLLVEESLLAQNDKRRCHNALHRIISFVHAVREKVQDLRKSVNLDAVRSNLMEFVHSFGELIVPDGHHVNEQARHFWQAVETLTENKDRKRYDFVLFGCSETIVNALRRKPKGVTLGLWIAEARPKSQHGPYNAQTYIDAYRYAQMLLSAKTPDGAPLSDDIEINIIPDASVASFIERAQSGCFSFPPQRMKDRPFLPRVNAVVFGANGVYVSAEECVAHSAGHLGLAIIARYLAVPVVVVASALKIEDSPTSGWEVSFRDDGWKWITSDQDLQDRLLLKGKDRRQNVHAWNLREDHLPLSVLSAIATECGSVVARGGSKYFEQRETVNISKELARWKQITEHRIPSLSDYRLSTSGQRSGDKEESANHDPIPITKEIRSDIGGSVRTHSRSSSIRSNGNGLRRALRKKAT